MKIINKRRVWFTISLTLVIGSLLIFTSNFISRGKAMNFGIDFTGGTFINLRYNQQITLDDIATARNLFHEYGHTNVSIQKSGEFDLAIRLKALENQEREKIFMDLQKSYPKLELLEVDTIGPVIGKELRNQAILALLVASLLIIIYVSFRFRFEYAVAALIALYHDALITAGIMALLWREVDTAFVAAILTIMGYSINDTIVIFDRVRENLKKRGKGKLDFGKLVEESIVQTLPRSINTVLTTLIMAGTLLLFGGATIRNFALTLTIGFLIGTYSSIFLASPILVVWQKWHKRR